MDACQADQVARELEAGNQRFLGGQSLLTGASSREKLGYTSRHGQTPKAIILCCSDSRAPVERVLDQDVGDLFVMRVAGNVVDPALIGSAEYAAASFQPPLILVMGHTNCGAVKATLDHIEHKTPIFSDNIKDIVGRIEPHVHGIACRHDLSHDEKMAEAVEANVRASMAALLEGSPYLSELVARGEIEVRGAVMDLATGEVSFLGDVEASRALTPARRVAGAGRVPGRV